MRKAVSAILGVLLVAGTLAAQSHDNNTERKASDEMSVAADLRVGAVTLPAGDYRIVCDRTQITFTRTLDGKRFQVPCKGKDLPKKADITKVMTNVDKNGVRYLDKLLIRGSNVEHAFD